MFGLALVLLSVIFSQSFASEAPKVSLTNITPSGKPKIGGKSSFACQAIAGTLPLEITWLRNGKQIKDTDSLRIRTNEDISNLLIDSIASSHTGNYSCKISNRFGSDSRSIEFKVEGPPSWIMRPQNMRMRYGQSGSLKCSASGYPSPNIQWQFKKDAHWVSIGNSDGFEVQDNGEELVIPSATRSHSGLYGCSAKNGIKPDLWAELEVNVDGNV